VVTHARRLPVLRQNVIRATSRLSGMPNGRRQPIKLGLTARLRVTVGKAATYRQAGQSCHQVGSPGESRGGKDGLVVRVVLGRPRQAQSRRSPDVPMVQAVDFADWRNVSQLRRPAYDLAKRNNGAPGIDGVTFERSRRSASRRFWCNCATSWKRTYRPQRTRRVEIPKDGGTSFPSRRHRSPARMPGIGRGARREPGRRQRAPPPLCALRAAALRKESRAHPGPAAVIITPTRR
jgi:hypothetical protein